MDVITAIASYLSANVTLNGAINTPLLKDGNNIALRLTPSSINTEYIEGYTGDVAFQLLVQDASNSKAMNVCQDIYKALHGNKEAISNCISLRCTTLPNWVEKTDKNNHIYTALFVAEIE